MKINIFFNDNVHQETEEKMGPGRNLRSRFVPYVAPSEKRSRKQDNSKSSKVNTTVKVPNKYRQDSDEPPKLQRMRTRSLTEAAVKKSQKAVQRQNGKETKKSNLKTRSATKKTDVDKPTRKQKHNNDNLPKRLLRKRTAITFQNGNKKTK